MKQVEELTKKGLRVLGVAEAEFDDDQLPSEQNNFTLSLSAFLVLLIQFALVLVRPFAKPIKQKSE